MSTMAYTNRPMTDKVQSSRVHPQKFALWLALAVMTMSFAGLTSAYIVRSNAPNWTEFVMPVQFTYSAIIMIISSLTIQAAVWAWKKEKMLLYKVALGATLLLALGFVASQYIGWKALQNIGIYLDGNPSGSFVYVISFIHVAHLAVGLLLLVAAFFRSLTIFNNAETLELYRTDGNKRIGIELLSTYWHFVDLLWLYLLIFFTLS